MEVSSLDEANRRLVIYQRWDSAKLETEDTVVLKEKALQLIKSALMAAVTGDVFCGGILNVIWLTKDNVKVTEYTAIELLVEMNSRKKPDSSDFFFFSQEEDDVINDGNLATLLRCYGVESPTAVIGFGTVVGDFCMFKVKIPIGWKKRFKRDCTLETILFFFNSNLINTNSMLFQKIISCSNRFVTHWKR